MLCKFGSSAEFQLNISNILPAKPNKNDDFFIMWGVNTTDLIANLPSDQSSYGFVITLHDNRRDIHESLININSFIKFNVKWSLFQFKV